MDNDRSSRSGSRGGAGRTAPLRLSRRTLLRRAASAGLALAGGALAACARLSGGTAPAPGRGQPSSPSPSPTPATPADWRSLAGGLQGTLIRPDQSGYAQARELYNPEFDRIHPAAVAYCASAADVQRCIDFVRRHPLDIALRSGGHSYAGYSTTTGLVVDVSRLHAVLPDSAAATAQVGAGARMIDIYAGLAAAGVCVPGASCPTVGIAGLALGGGLGVLDRKLGLTLDNTLAVQIVTADGVVRTVDADHDPDLFWACRGGGGGNFGAVVGFRFRTHPTGDLALFDLQWDWAGADQAIPAWLAWASAGPDALWSNCVLTTGNPPRLEMSGVFQGTPQDLSVLLDALQTSAGAAPRARQVWQSGFLTAMLSEAGCANRTVTQCHLSSTPGGELGRTAFAAKSDFLARPLSSSGVTALLDAVASHGGGGGGLLLDASGGAINRVAPDATAFCHRNDLCSLQYYTSWSETATASVRNAQRAWLTHAWQSMRPHVSGYAYQNYIDPQLPDWAHAYYGANLPRLERVKRRYDPDNLFRFAQSIPLGPGAAVTGAAR